jgi:uncharacterized glyoxalase superfamily protein PhnB
MEANTVTQTRTGNAFMYADEYGRALPKFSVNLLVRSVERSLPFYRDVLGVTVRYSDGDFAALCMLGTDFMLHADHAYDRHPLYAILQAACERGVGAELRFLGVDPDEVEQRARRAGATIVQPAKDYAHGWREVTLLDPDGYIWTVGSPLPGKPSKIDARDCHSLESLRRHGIINCFEHASELSVKQRWDPCPNE